MTDLNVDVICRRIEENLSGAGPHENITRPAGLEHIDRVKIVSVYLDSPPGPPLHPHLDHYYYRIRLNKRTVLNKRTPSIFHG